MHIHNLVYIQIYAARVQRYRVHTQSRGEYNASSPSQKSRRLRKPRAGTRNWLQRSRKIRRLRRVHAPVDVVSALEGGQTGRTLSTISQSRSTSSTVRRRSVPRALTAGLLASVRARWRDLPNAGFALCPTQGSPRGGARPRVPRRTQCKHIASLGLQRHRDTAAAPGGAPPPWHAS